MKVLCKDNRQRIANGISKNHAILQYTPDKWSSKFGNLEKKDLMSLLQDSKGQRKKCSILY